MFYIDLMEKSLVKQPNLLTKAHYSMGLLEKRIVYLALKDSSLKAPNNDQKIDHTHSYLISIKSS